MPEIVGAKNDRPKDAETALMRSFALWQVAVDQGADFVLETPCMVARKLFQQAKNFTGKHLVIGALTTRWQEPSGYSRSTSHWYTNNGTLRDHLVPSLKKARSVLQQTWDRVAYQAVLPYAVGDQLPHMFVGLLDKVVVEGMNASGEYTPAGPVPLEVPIMPEETGTYYDGISGAPLKADKVRAARREGLEWVRKRHIYDKIPVSVCFQETGRKPVTL